MKITGILPVFGGLRMIANQSGFISDTWLKLTLVFFLCLFAFSVGTFIGKEMSDKEQRMASAIAEQQGRSTASVAPAEAMQPNQIATNEEIKALSEEFLDDTPVSGVEGSEPAVAPENKMAASQAEKILEQELTLGAAPSKAARPNMAMDKKVLTPTADQNRIAQGDSPAPTPVENKRRPTSVLPKFAPATIGKYTLQVASFSTQAEATKRATELRSKGFESFIVPAVVQERQWFRVSVGLFESRGAATDYYKNQFDRQLAGVDTALVQKIVK